MNNARIGRSLPVALLATLVVGLLGAASAVAAPVWQLSPQEYPTNFAPGGAATIILPVTNAGDVASNGTVTVVDTLPPGLTATGFGFQYEWECSGSTVVTCTNNLEHTPSLAPGARIPYAGIMIEVSVDPGASGTLDNSIEVSGGEALDPLEVRQAITVSAAEPGFGVVPGSFAAEVLNQDGTLDTQAGSHPFAASTGFMLSTTRNAEGLIVPVGGVRDIHVELPAGFVGNPQATPQCPASAIANGPTTCPVTSQVGIVDLTLTANGNIFNTTDPVYNMKPADGETAAFAFNVTAPIHISGSLRTDGDYGITTTIAGVSQAYGLLGTKLTLWGVPADPAHDLERFNEQTFEEGLPSSAPEVPFLTNPVDCSHGPFTTLLRVDSYEDPTVEKTYESTTPTGVEGCDKLSFEPTLKVTADPAVAGEPSGLNVDVGVPQSSNPDGLGTPPLKKAVVMLPQGVVVSPAAADGLQGCTDEQLSLHSNEEAACPGASKIGTVSLTTPLLADPMTGSIYLGSQTPTQLLRVFLVLHGPGLLVKLAGRVDTDPVTGRLTATFDENPQVPFSDLSLQFKSGPRAPLSLPGTCGMATASAQFTSWATSEPTLVSSGFQVSGDGMGAPCGAQGFSPSFSAGTVSPTAGAFSPFSVTFNRRDADQDLGSVTVHAPEGLLGVLKSVPLCEEPQAEQGACGTASLIGHTTVGAGPGSNPFYLGGSVYLTGPYKGAPFGLSIVVPAIAGPFNLGNVVVRAAIAVDPTTAALTITSDPLPTILQGIPLQIRSVNVTVDRAGFMFNPTSCDPTAVTGTLTSTQGASASVSSRFQAADCASLAFKPKFSASVAGKSSRANGAALDVKITSAAGQANIGRVAVSLPKALPSRLSTIQKACPEATFAANPSSCPAGSLVGTGTALTPILAQPLSGPAYLVSHGGAAFPDLVVVLEGRGEATGVKVDLKGAINISKAGITSSTFNNVPDVPISSFELKLPTGPHSALTGNLPAKAKGSFCGQSLTMPTSITGHNGTGLKQSTKLAVTGCTAAKKKAKPERTKTAKKSTRRSA